MGKTKYFQRKKTRIKYTYLICPREDGLQKNLNFPVAVGQDYCVQVES